MRGLVVIAIAIGVWLVAVALAADWFATSLGHSFDASAARIDRRGQ